VHHCIPYSKTEASSFQSKETYTPRALLKYSVLVFFLVIVHFVTALSIVINSRLTAQSSLHVVQING